ncbi:unnamed protein product [Closterium sp. NIES-54]
MIASLHLLHDCIVASVACLHRCALPFPLGPSLSPQSYAVPSPPSLSCVVGVQCKREDLIDKIQAQVGEGCNMYGVLEVNKVAGNFHFAPAKVFYTAGISIFDLVMFHDTVFNISHTVNSLSFGAKFPGAVNPLDKAQWVQEGESGMYQYFIKVVPTMYTDSHNHTIASNQFSVTEHFRPAPSHDQQSLPGVFFFYDLSPIKVQYSERYTSFLHFLTNVCAIVGGIFTVTGMVDAFIYHSQRAIKKKIDLGKLN